MKKRQTLYDKPFKSQLRSSFVHHPNDALIFSVTFIDKRPAKIDYFLKIFDLKIELLAININMPNYFRHLCFFFGQVNNK